MAGFESDANAAFADVPADDAVRMAALPALLDVASVSPLSGGITNRNYRVTLRRGASMVIRLSDPGSSDLAIDREHEYRNSLAAAASGAAPDVVGYLPGRGVLAVAWVEGTTLTDSDVANPHTLSRIAAACRTLHGGPAFGNRFDMFAIQEGYRAVVRDRGYRLPERYDEFAPAVARLRAAMARHPEPLVPCNNDLLAANFIDDGERLWLIDYEYSGMNEASFEIGNVWSEATLAEPMLTHLVAAYWGESSPHRVARARLWALMSQYGWMLWASIQAGQSDIDFDYWSWGLEKYERAVTLFDSPNFADLMDDLDLPTIP